MPKPRQNELIRCRHFCWRIGRRDGVWQADGRSNPINAGRHSLGTEDRSEALKSLDRLDEVTAVRLGLSAPPAVKSPATECPLLLEDGRKLYENHIKRPREVGGVRTSTQMRYRAPFDKFVPFAKARGVSTWNAVSSQTLIAYASHLKENEYASATLRKELTTLVQAHKWLVEEKHLVGTEPLRLKIKKAESERAYCYTSEQVAAMIDTCLESEPLHWLAGVIIALACTGLRISELASLQWKDIDLRKGQLLLTDESGQSTRHGKTRRELKSGRSRQLPIHSELVRVIAGQSRASAYVFYGPRGGRLKPDTVRNVLIRHVIRPLQKRFPSHEDEQGFKDGRLHSFRHYFASTCATNGVSERVAMEWLGHKDSEMVRHYFHLNDAESRRQMDRLEPIGDTGKGRRRTVLFDGDVESGSRTAPEAA